MRPPLTVHGNQAARLVEGLADVVALAEGQASSDRRARAGGHGRVQGIDVEAEVDRPLALALGAIDVVQRHVNDLRSRRAVSVPPAIPLLLLTLPMPYLSTSCMLNALMPFSRRIFRSPESMSRRPMYTNRSLLSGAFPLGSQVLNGSTSVPARPRRKETGQPCRLPEGVVSGVLMSACASIQIRAASGCARSEPATVPSAWRGRGVAA